MRKSILCLLSIFTLMVSTQSCKDDSDDSVNTSTGLMTDSQKAKLYDKVWYSTSASGGIEHEFLSDGTLRLSLSLEGRWSWQNKSDTMDVKPASGPKYQYVFRTIDNSSMSLSFSTDNFKEVFTYRDKP